MNTPAVSRIRRALLLAPVTAAGCAGLARREPLEIITADVRPLSIAEGPRRGIVLDIISEAAAAAGREAHFRFLPFADAMAATQARPGTLMAPLARSPQREAAFSWIAKIIDVPQAMGTLRDQPEVDLARARSLARIGVVRGGVQEGFLRAQGLENLAPYATAREIAEALVAGEVQAWYGTSTEVAVQFEAIGRAGQVRVGPTLQVAPVWLAAHKDPGAAPAAALAAALAKMERSGAITRHYQNYVTA